MAEDTTAPAAASNGSKNNSNDQQKIEALKKQLAQKEQECQDFQRGLEAQVHMVMELEELEQKEMREYEAKIDANKRLINELGERVGQESKQKAELESQLTYTTKKCSDQAVQIERLEQLVQVNAELLKAAKADSLNDFAHGAGDNGKNQWEVYAKLEAMMETNQNLVMELAKASTDIHVTQKQVSDKELLCLELSSQLDKLASQLNTADEDMAAVKNELTNRENELQAVKQRVEWLEASLMKDDDDEVDNKMDSSEVDVDDMPSAQPPSPVAGDKKGKAVLMKQLKLKEEANAQLQRERDASLSKATKLSLALAGSREHVDALQEKLDYQNSIVDRIMGKRNQASPSNNAVPPRSTPRRQFSFGKAKAADAVNNNNTPTTTTPTPPQSDDKKFDGRRIRNFFNRGRSASRDSNNGGGTPTNNNNGNNTGTPPPAPTSNRGLFGRKTSGGGGDASSSEKGGSSSNLDVSATDPNEPEQPQPSTENTNPFDDDDKSAFTNEAVGKVNQLEEDSQGGGGDVNLALTL